MHKHHADHLSGHAAVLPGHRARRGKVQAAVMALLAEQAMHGYQIIRELGDRSGGAWSPSPGSVYPILQSLEQSGMVVSEQTGGKRVFSLTELGRKHASMLPDQAPWDEMRDESDPAGRLRGAFRGLMTATTQVARSNNTDLVEKTTKIISEARRDIYLLLAGDE